MFYCEESAPSYVLTTESTIQSVRSTRRQCSYPWNVPFDGAYSSALDAGRVIPAVITSFPQRTHVIHTAITSFPQHTHIIPATHCRHSRVGGNLDARRAASVDVGAALRRPPRRPGAEERGTCGDEEAAGKEEQEQQPARYASAASSGELVRRNGR